MTTRLSMVKTITAKHESFVRYQSPNGHGIFAAINEFENLLDIRAIKIPRKIVHEIETLVFWLRHHTPVARSQAYQDDRSRKPITWYRATAMEHLRHADRLYEILNRQGMNIKRIESTNPGKVLYEDEFQIVTRRPRTNAPHANSFLETRIERRRKRQTRRRVSNDRKKARTQKSGI